MNIFVGNLNFQTTEKQLEELFTTYGEVESVKIITDKFSGRSRGFGFVEMPQEAQAEEAINQLQDYILNSRTLVVNQAKPREDNNRY